MINFPREQVILLRDSPNHIPGRPSLCTVHRWRDRGFRGVPLESFKVGGRWFTSIEAITRFIHSMNGLSSTSQNPESLAEQCRKADATTRARAIYGER